MIDRQQPDRSMLLQYALPGAIAEYDHPDVPGYKPAFRGQNDPRYRQVLDWLGKTLKAQDPNYGIDYVVPGSTSSATQPTSTPAATQPATQASSSSTTRPGGMRAQPATRPTRPPQPTPPPRVGTYPNTR
jgi:hypothetical protein